MCVCACNAARPSENTVCVCVCACNAARPSENTVCVI